MWDGYRGTTGLLFNRSPASSDTKPRSSRDFSVLDGLDTLRPVRSASSVILLGGWRRISCNSGQLSSINLPMLCAELNQIFGSPGLVLMPLAMAIVRALNVSIPIRKDFHRI